MQQVVMADKRKTAILKQEEEDEVNETSSSSNVESSSSSSSSSSASSSSSSSVTKNSDEAPAPVSEEEKEEVSEEKEEYTASSSASSSVQQTPTPTESESESESESSERNSETEIAPDPFHIGNHLSVVSDRHGLTMGRVIYRDAALLRILPDEVSDRAVDFRLIGDGLEFAPELGVTDVELFERRDESDYYVDFLGVRVGEALEFFTGNGLEAAPTGIVAEVIKTDTQDAVRLEDGRVLEFRGRGPEPPIVVIRVRTAANLAADGDGGGAAGATTVRQDGVAEEERRRKEETERTMMDLLSEIAPTAQVEIIPTAERTFPESLQREDLFQDLLAGLSEKQKLNPRRIRTLEREVDILLTLKNNAIQFTPEGGIEGIRSQELNTFADVLEHSSAPIPILVPIVNAARILNIDRVDPADGSFKPSDVLPRDLNAVEAAAAVAATASATESSFYSYIYEMMSSELVTLTGAGRSEKEWRQDQDVIRTAGIEESVQSLSNDLPVGDTGSKKYQPVTLAYLVSGRKMDRSIRVLAPMRSVNPRTGVVNTLAPSDSTQLRGYVVLPPKAALKLRPPTRPGDLPMALLYSASLAADNLPTIHRTLLDLFSEDASPLHAWNLAPTATTDTSIAEWLRGVLRFAVHPSESLGPRTLELLSLLDSFGVGHKDRSVEVARVLRQWVAQSQALWLRLLSERRAALKQLVESAPERVFQSVTGADSPAWPALLTADPLKEIMEDIRRRNPAIAEAPTLLAAALTQEAQGDAAPLAWITLGNSDLDVASATAALTASRSYTLRRKALRDVTLLRLRAEPEINPCQHVKLLEGIRGVSNVTERAQLLREFVEEYQGGRNGEWMTCTLCHQNAVCYHELMELEALAQPTRMDAILKQLLIRYGGNRYEGHIACRNCGQAIQELEFDQHVEFDDEGRPITGASVLTAEQLEDPEETEWDRATAALIPAGSVARPRFAKVSQREIADALAYLAERAGVLLPSDVFVRIVDNVDQYVAARIPSQAAYELQQKREMIKASTSLKAATGVAASARAVSAVKAGAAGITYAEVGDTMRVAAMIALLAIELEIAPTPIVVNNPLPHCEYQRGGWPLKPVPAGTKVTLEEFPKGFLPYVACAVASIQRDVAPWNSLRWRGLTDLKPRITGALTLGWNAAQVIMGEDPSKAKVTATLPFANALKDAIDRAKSDDTMAIRNAMVSHTDQIPVGFRPEPFPAKVARPALEKNPLPFLAAGAAAIDGGASVTDATVTEVGAAIRTQSAAIVTELHDAASASIAALPTRPTAFTDFVCCPTPLRDVEAGALLGVPGSAPLIQARNLVRGAIPTATNAGTHLWQSFQPFVSAPVEQAQDESAFPKLFLKFCYIGPQVGEPHEFSFGNVCRQCGFLLGKHPDTVDAGKEGATILASQQGDLRVETTQAAFEALADAVRRRRIVSGDSATNHDDERGFDSLIRHCMESASESLQSVGMALRQIVTDMVASSSSSSSPSSSSSSSESIGASHAVLWNPLVTVMDELRDSIVSRIGSKGRTSKLTDARAKETGVAMDMIETVTDDPFIEGPRTLQEYWCAKSQGLGQGLAVNDGLVNAQIKKWFGNKIKNSSHSSRITALIAENVAWYAPRTPLTDEEKAIIRRIGLVLGPILAAWLRTMRPTILDGERIVMEDVRILLRTLVFAVWKDAVTPGSWMYEEEGILGDALQGVTAAAVADWSRALMVHVKQQFIRFSKSRIKHVLQQRTEMERTAIVNEIVGQADDDLRAAEYLKKKFRIGRWALGQNLRAYDADLLDAEVEQRRAQGIVETVFDPVLLESQKLAAAEGEAPPEDGYDVNQGAAGDDY